MTYVHPMKVLVSDRTPAIITTLNQFNPSFEAVVGTPLAYEIDAVVSPANTLGIMNAGSAVRYRTGHLLLVFLIFVILFSRSRYALWLDRSRSGNLSENDGSPAAR